MGIAEFPPNQKLLTKGCVLEYLHVRAKFSGVQEENSTIKHFSAVGTFITPFTPGE